MVYRDKKNRIVMKGTICLDTGEKKHYMRILKGVTTLKEGRIIEAKFKDEYNSETELLDKQVYTLRDFIKKYDNDKENQIKSTTKASNMYAAKHFEILFNKNIKAITSSDIKKITDEKYKNGLSVEYINKLLAYINKIFNHAISLGILTNNPVKRIPKYKNPDEVETDDDYYTPEEFKKFIKHFPRNKENGEEYMCFVIVNVLYFMGFRFNEATALTRKDIDMEKRTIRINKTVARYINGQSFIITKPKTKNSNRTITMPDVLYDLMKEYLEWYSYLLGTTKDTFLFGIERPLLAKIVKKRMVIASKASNLRVIKIHSLRKSNASLLCNAGAPVSVVAKRLGHTQNECYKTYVKWFHTDDEKLVEVLNSNFNLSDLNE